MTFAKPFRLAGLDGLQPPGTYTVIHDEEQLDDRSFMSWRQIAASLQIGRGGKAEYAAINMQNLREALLRDTDQSTDPPDTPSTAIGERRRRVAGGLHR